MGGLGFRQLWLGWMLIGALTSAASAKTVGQMWAEGKIAIVTSADELTRLKMQSDLKGLQCRLLTPPEAIGERFAGEQILWLLNRRELAFWSPVLLEKFPIKPETLPENQVVVNVWNKRSKPSDPWGWETLVLASDHDQLMQALNLLLPLESRKYNDSPVLFNYRVDRAVVVAAKSKPLCDWVGRQASDSRQFKTQVFQPDQVSAEQLAGAKILSMVLTHSDWQALSEPCRAALAPYLTDEMRESLEGESPAPRVLSAVREVDGTTCAVAVGPSERFLTGICGGDRTRGASGLTWPGLGAAHAAALQLADWRAAPRLLLAAEPTQDRAQQLALDEVTEAVAGELTRLGFDVTTPSRIQMAQDLQDLQMAMEGGAAGGGLPADFDAMALVRITTVTGEIRQEAGEAECLTSPPDSFTTPQPREPDPRDKNGPFGGHKYEPCLPGGAPYPAGGHDFRKYNPAFIRDHREWEYELMPAWREAKRDHERQVTYMTVDWRQTVETVREVQVRGSLRLMQQGAPVVTLELAGAAEKREAETQPSSTRGWGSRPPRPTLMRPLREIDELLVPGAARQAAGRVGSLEEQALLPKDAGRSGSRHAPAETPGAPGTRPDRQEPKPGEPALAVDQLEVVAIGSLADGEAVAEQRASLAAQQQAVREVIGQYLPAATAAAKAVVIEDTLLPQAPALARVLEVTRKETTDEGLRATFLVEVRRGPLRSQLVSLGLLRRWRVMIIVPEELRNRVVPDPAAENALMRHFLDAGFPVIDAEHSARLRDNREVMARLQGGDAKELAALRQEFGAEILVTGEAFGEQFENALMPGAQLCRARLEVKAIDLSTAEVLAADDEHQTGRDTTIDLASKVAFRNCADALADRLIETLCRRPMPTPDAARLELQVTGLEGYTALHYLIEALEATEGVREVKSGDFNDATGARIEVQVDLAQERTLPMLLETHAYFVPFKIKIGSVNASLITCRAGASPNGSTVPAAIPPTPPGAAPQEQPDEAVDLPEPPVPAVTPPEKPPREQPAAPPAPTEITALEGHAINFKGVGMVPFKPIFEWLGVKYEWRAATKAIVGDWTRGETTYQFVIRIGEKFVDLDGDRLALPAAPMVRGGVTYVPARLLVGLMGLEVKWDEAARQAMIIYGWQAATLPIK